MNKLIDIASLPHHHIYKSKVEEKGLNHRKNNKK